VNPRQQTAGRIAGNDVGIDRFGELVFAGIFDLHTVERFAVLAVRFAPDRV